MHYRKLLSLIPLLLACAGVAAQPGDTRGAPYRELSTPQPTDAEAGQVEVIEFFSYACPHCNAFEPYIKAWKRNKPEWINFKPVPVAFRESWVPLAKAYYAAETLGVVDQVHTGIFKAVHDENRPADTAEQIGDIVADLGVDRERFVETMNGFNVDRKINESQQMLKAYGVRGVPSMAVDGRYYIGTSMVADYREMLTVVDRLAGSAREPTE